MAKKVKVVKEIKNPVKIVNEIIKDPVKKEAERESEGDKEITEITEDEIMVSESDVHPATRRFIPFRPGGLVHTVERTDNFIAPAARVEDEKGRAQIYEIGRDNPNNERKYNLPDASAERGGRNVEPESNEKKYSERSDAEKGKEKTRKYAWEI